MGHRWRSYLGTGLLVLLVGACERSSTDPVVEDGLQVRLRIDHLVNGTPLFLDHPRYVSAAGDTFSITRLAYVVADVVLEREDGSTTTHTVNHARIAGDDERRTVALGSVPPGRYVGCSLRIGLPDERNTWGALGSDPALDPLRWPDALGGGYYFLRLDGAVTDGAEAAPFRVGLGTIDDGGTPASGTVVVEVPDFDAVVDDGTRDLAVTMDVGAWLDDPVYDLTQVDGEGDRAAQSILLQNAPGVFARPAPEPLVIEVPVRFPPLIPAEDNPTTVAGVLLGRYLFHDPVLSGDSTLACAGCHQPELGFADDRALSEGIDGTEGRRNASALSNLGFLTRFFWDGRAQSLEDQALEPVADPIEMHLSWDEAEARLASHRFYPTLFERAFGTRVVTRERTVKAIAQFERTLVSANSKFDRERRGEATYTPEEALGEQIFQNERGDCFHCHFVTPVFTDNLFHNVGIDSVLIDRGLGELTGEVRDMGLFKTPSLRNVEFTAPYMHDGRFETLTEVVEHYNSGGFLTPTVDPLIRVGQGLGLTDEEVQGLVAFLKALSDPDFLTNPAHRSPFPASSR